MHAVATLLEKDFLFGAAVLYNSLVKNGFDGVFVVGCKSPSTLPKAVIQEMQVRRDGLPVVEFLEVSTEWHLTNFKAHFLLSLFQSRPDFDKITYLDPDIVFATCPWAWVDSWPDHGPALCGDVNWRLPSEHPTRHEWNVWIQKTGHRSRSTDGIYFNGGLLGIKRDDVRFLELWNQFIQCASGKKNLSVQGDIDQWRRGMRSNPFLTPDQDALNMAAMSWEGRLSTLGPDAMGFTSGQVFFPHAVGANKPWRRQFLLEAVLGKPPRLVDKLFWQNAGHPIAICSRATIAVQRANLTLAAFVGRFYRSC
jgi:hypothetical protein